MIFISPTNLPLYNGLQEDLTQLCLRATVTAQAIGKAVILCYEDAKVVVYPQSYFLDIHSLVLCVLQLKSHPTKLKIGGSDEDINSGKY